MRLSSAIILLLIVAGVISCLTLLFQESSAGEYSAIDSGDTAWMLIASALVMLMTPAVGFFYGGMVKSKNVISVIKQTIVILSVVTLQWVVVGYSLVFGDDYGGLIGGPNFIFLRGVSYPPNDTYAQTIPHLLFMVYQGMFAIITPALIIGAVVERIKFRTLLLFTLLWTTLIYDPLAHWVWGDGGFLRSLGALDFAGGAVVHVSAGFSAFAAAMLVGRRINGRSLQYDANNVPFVLLGGALLWFGWFGFNAGSALSSSALAVNAFVTTNIAAAAGALTWMLLSFAESKKPSAMATITGGVCGLVAITPASGFVGPVASIAIGIIAGVVTYSILLYRSQRIKIDDTLDVFAAHGMGGLTGALLTGIFAEKAVNGMGNNGLLFGNPNQFFIQLIAVAVCGAYAFVGTWVLLKIISIFTPLRVSRKEEEVGLDLAVHGETGYRI